MIQGVVSKINTKVWGNKTLHSFFIKGQDGLFSLGEHPPTFREGDSIKFEVKQQGKYLYAQDIVQWTGEGATTAPSVQESVRTSSRLNGSFKGGSFKGGKSEEEKQYWAKRDSQQEVTQRRIEIQAARNAAIESARFLIEKGFIKFPTKVADQYDGFLELVNQLIDEFLKNTGVRVAEDSDKSTRSVDMGREMETSEGSNNVGTQKEEGNWD